MGFEGSKTIQYGKIEVPINEELGAPMSPEVWASFLTGREVGSLVFDKAGTAEVTLKILRFLRRYIPIGFGLGRRVEKRAPSRFPKLKFESFLDLTKSKEINMPYYSHDHSALDIIYQFKSEKLPVREAVKLLFDLYEKRKEQILTEAEKIEDVDVVVAFMHFPDSLQHFLFTRPSKIKDLYVDLDKYVSVLKNRVKGTFIIISDHGLSIKEGTHSKYGFYSANTLLTPKPKRITDFFAIVTSLHKNK